MTTICKFTHKKKLVELQVCSNLFWKECQCLSVCLSVCMYGLIFLTYSTYLEPQKLVIFGLQLCAINHKNFRGSWNLVLIILGAGASLPITHFFGEEVCHHILKQINHFAWRHEVCCFNHFLVQYLISSGNVSSMWLRWVWNWTFWLGVENLKNTDNMTKYKI